MKKISAIIICFLLLLTCTLTGCAGFSVDRVKYYNEVIASVNGTKITRFELLNAYNSYGQSYFTQSGDSKQKAMEKTLDLLVDREVLYQYAKENEKFKPTEFQVNQAVKNIFDSLDEQMAEYATDAKKALNIKVEKAEDSTSSSTPYKYSDYVYKTRAELVKVYYTDNTYTVESPNQAKTTFFKYEINFIKEPEEVGYEKLIDDAFLTDFEDKDIYAEIRKKYIQHLEEDIEKEYLKDVEFASNQEKQVKTKAFEARLIESFTKGLINYEYYLRDKNGNKFNKNTNDLMDRYFERNFTSQIKGQYLTNFQNNYIENYDFDINKLKQAFVEKYMSSFNKYSDDFQTYISDLKNIGTDGDSVLYHPDIADSNFGYVIHTLFNFSDKQKSDIENLKAEYDNKSFKEYKEYYDDQVEENKLSSTQLEEIRQKLDTYKEAYKEIVLQTEVVARDPATGVEEKVDVRPTLKDLLTDTNSDYRKVLRTKNLNDFLNFMFKYSQDTATLSSGMPYVVGSYDKDGGETFSTYSAMEEAFTDESVKLMSSGKGSISDYTDLDISNMCVTSYGVHIVYYVDDVNAYDVKNYSNADFFTEEDENYGSENNLYTKIINPLTGETYFDMLLDTVYPDESGMPSNTGYSDYEETLIDNLQSQFKVTIYKTKLKATKETIK